MWPSCSDNRQSAKVKVLLSHFGAKTWEEYIIYWFHYIQSVLKVGIPWRTKLKINIRCKVDVIGRRERRRRRGGGGGSKCSVRPIFIYFIKENWICAINRHYVTNILLAINLPFDPDIRQWSHALMIPLHCLIDKSNNRTRCQFEYDVALVFLFLFDFIHSHARCCCCSIVCLRFQVRQIKQVEWKMSTKKLFFKQKCRDSFGQLHIKNAKPQKSR